MRVTHILDSCYMLPRSTSVSTLVQPLTGLDVHEQSLRGNKDCLLEVRFAAARSLSSKVSVKVSSCFFHQHFQALLEKFGAQQTVGTGVCVIARIRSRCHQCHRVSNAGLFALSGTCSVLPCRFSRDASPTSSKTLAAPASSKMV